MPAKGQKMDEAAKALIGKAKQASTIASFDWSRIEDDIWDVIPSLGNRNREKKFITLREFKKLIDSGESLDDIKIKHGVSKHLVVFYSAMLKGTFALPKIDFESYYRSGMSLDEIAAKTLVPREYLTILRQLYGIKNTGAKYIQRKLTEIPVTPRQWQIIMGSMLGDASKMSPTSIRFKHGGPQKDYVEWKYAEMPSLASDEVRVVENPKDGKIFYSHYFYTKANTDIHAIIQAFHPNGGKKRVPSNDCLDQLDELAVAVWFMDDGKTDFRFKNCEKYENTKPEIYFCTDSFSETDVMRLIAWLDRKFGIITTMAKSSRGHPRIRVRSTSTDKFLSMIDPHVIPLMKYKTLRTNAMEKRDLLIASQEDETDERTFEDLP